MTSMSKPLKVYLAGPDVFRSDAKEYGDQLKTICEEHGLQGLHPADTEIDHNSLEPFGVATSIFEANVELIHECDAVIANITPFRGPNMDVGTAFEIGYASALGKLIIGYTEDNRDFLEKAADFFSDELRERNGEWFDPDSNRIENFGLPENLMISCAVTDVVDDFEAAVNLLVTIRREIDDLF